MEVFETDAIVIQRTILNTFIRLVDNYKNLVWRFLSKAHLLIENLNIYLHCLFVPFLPV